MKVLAFVDLHGQPDDLEELNKKAKQADIIICAGDHTIFEHYQDSMLAAFNKWKKPVYIIHGNHEREDTLKEACKKYKHLIFCHGEKKVIKGITFLFWGGGGLSSYDKELDDKHREWKNTTGQIVLVTHAPPYKTNIDLMVFGHVGSKTIRKVVKTIKPHLHICGHIHDTEGAEDKIGNTHIINVGPQGLLIDL